MALRSFLNVADEDTLQHLRDLSERAREACGTFAEVYNDAALVKWARVLQRSLTAAIRKFPIEFHTGSPDENGTCNIEPARVWRALTRELRAETIGALGRRSFSSICAYLCRFLFFGLSSYSVRSFEHRPSGNLCLRFAFSVGRKICLNLNFF